MKTILLIAIYLIPQIWISAQAQKNNPDTKVLIGTWEMDMSPYDKTDDNFAMMDIIKVNETSFEGDFYREGVQISNANINTQTGTIYGALVSGDGTGQYNSAFYLKDGKLYGTTHSIGRDFLAVWTAVKIN